MGKIIGLIIVGLIVGALGRLLNPGPDPMGWILTIAIGIASVLIVGLIVGGIFGWILAVIVAAILVSVVQRVLPSHAPGPV
ncbi:MAG: GlsB/YeaQ/YmgE family stress response membrane protein [Actinobacteria bacterium]|nr:MAG: GlsB/YeaQ/YmgE family stress response membrane protein [Actinomycetota bacterium]